MPESILTKDYPQGAIRTVKEITCPHCEIVSHAPAPTTQNSFDEPSYFECVITDHHPDGTVIKLWLCLNCSERFWTKEKEL